MPCLGTGTAIFLFISALSILVKYEIIIRFEIWWLALVSDCINTCLKCFTVYVTVVEQKQLKARIRNAIRLNRMGFSER